jgi:hypothetical protein
MNTDVIAQYLSTSDDVLERHDAFPKLCIATQTMSINIGINGFGRIGR